MYRVTIKEATPITRIEGDTVVLEGYALVSEEVYEAPQVDLSPNNVHIFGEKVTKIITLKPGFSVEVKSL